MAKKKEFENRISVSDMDKFMKDFPSGNKSDVTIGTTKLEVKPYVDVVTFGQIVEDVCSAAFGEDGMYMPYIQWYVTRAPVIEKYTNITMPQDMKKRFDMVDYLSSDSFSGGAFVSIYDEIVNAIGYQYYALLSAIDDRIDFEKGKPIRELNDAIRSISNRVRAVGISIEDLIDKAIEYIPKIQTENTDEDDEEKAADIKDFGEAIRRIVTDSKVEINDSESGEKADDE